MNLWEANQTRTRIALIRPGISRLALYQWYFLFGSREAPLGLLYLASYLTRHGYTVRIFDGEILDERQLYRELQAFQPEVIGLTSSTFSFFQAARVIQNLRKLFPSTLLLLGGPHASALPEDTMDKMPYLDGCVIGEGEETLLEITSGKPVRTIRGLMWRDRAGIVHMNQKRHLIQNLDQYQLVWELLRGFPGKYTPPWQSNRFGRSAALVASRGCPYSCIFCAGSVVHGKKRRAHSPAYTVALMQNLWETYGFTHFYFHDDHFTLDQQWLIEFCDRLVDFKGNLTWSCASRVETLNREILTLMRGSGCLQIGVGVESTSIRVLQRVAKETTREDLWEGLKRINDARIEAKVYLMIGTPQESMADLREIFNLLANVNMEHVQISYFTPLPGSMAFNDYPLPAHLWPKMNLLFPMIQDSLPICVLKLCELSIYLFLYGKNTFKKLMNILLFSKNKSGKAFRE